MNEYLPLYRCLEESVAKKLFAIKGVSDDVIAATMHLFMEKGDSSEVHPRADCVRYFRVNFYSFSLLFSLVLLF